MPTFSGVSPNATFGMILHVPSTNDGFDGVLRRIEDGKGGQSPFMLSNNAVGIGSITAPAAGELKTVCINDNQELVNGESHINSATVASIATKITVPVAECAIGDVLVAADTSGQTSSTIPTFETWVEAAPASNGDTGIKGQRYWDGTNGYMYECIAENTWVRSTPERVWS